MAGGADRFWDMLLIQFLQQWYALSDLGVEKGCTTPRPCAASSAATLAAKMHRPEPRCASSGTCRNGTSYIGAERGAPAPRRKWWIAEKRSEAQRHQSDFRIAQA